MKKYFAEFIGTLFLALLGCGTAVFVGCGTPAGVVGTALAFGIAGAVILFAVVKFTGAPLAGGALAALIWGAFHCDCCDKKAE